MSETGDPCVFFLLLDRINGCAAIKLCSVSVMKEFDINFRFMQNLHRDGCTVCWPISDQFKLKRLYRALIGLRKNYRFARRQSIYSLT